MVYKIEHLIYPMDIYIHIGQDIQETLHQFINSETKLIVDDNWGQCDGMVYRNILHKETNRYSLIIAFENVPSNKLIAHELVHVLHRLYQHIGQTNYGDENNAYLIEHLFEEVENAITQYKEEQSNEPLV